MTYEVTDIEYDLDGEEIELPTSMLITVPDDCDEDITEYLGDKISDITGYCHNSFCFQLLQV